MPWDFTLFSVTTFLFAGLIVASTIYMVVFWRQPPEVRSRKLRAHVPSRMLRTYDRVTADDAMPQST